MFPGTGAWSVTAATAASGGVTAAKGAVANMYHYCTGIDVSSDAAAVVTIESPAGTVLWQKRFAAAFESTRVFPPDTIVGAVGALLQVKVSASTSNVEANLQGYSTS